MGWYVLHCRQGQEQMIANSCTRHLSCGALERAFVFQCERLWKRQSTWELVRREMFPGYVFLQSRFPELLIKELEQFHGIFRALGENGSLISVYGEEESCLRMLCGESHILSISYGYKDQRKGISHIIRGPLRNMDQQIIRYDWHKRYAQVQVPFLRQKVIIWAGIDIACGMRAETASEAAAAL